MIGIHNNDTLYKKYFSSFETDLYYDTGDAGVMDTVQIILFILSCEAQHQYLYTKQDGYLYVMARTDDIINVSGVRIATAAVEEGIDL